MRVTRTGPILAAAIALAFVPSGAQAADWAGDAPDAVSDTETEYNVEPATFEERLRTVIASRMGAAFASAEHAYVKCPVLLQNQTDSGMFQECQALFGSGKTRTFVSLSFTVEDGAMTYRGGADTASIAPRRCAAKDVRGPLPGRWKLTAVKASPLAGCGSVALMASDMVIRPSGGDFSIRRSLPRKLAVHTHGTGTGGYPSLYVWRCTTSKRGVRAYSVACRNKVGEKFTVALRRAR